MIAFAIASLVLTSPTVETLPNGAEVIALHRPGLRYSAFRVSLDGGSLFDPPGRSGLASVACALLAQRLPDFHAQPGLRTVAIHGETDDIVAAFAAVATAMVDRDVSEPEFERARAQARSIRRAGATDPRATLLAVARRALHGSHPRAGSPQGSLRDIEDITRADVVGWLDRHIVAGGTIVGVASSSAATALTDAMAVANRLPGKTRPTLTLAAGTARTRRLLLVDRGADDDSTALIVHAMPDNPTLAQYAAVHAIGASFTGLVYRAVAETRGHVVPIAPFDGGVTTFAVAAPSGDLGGVVSAVIATLAEGPTDDEIEFGRRRAITELRLRRASVSGWLADEVERRARGVGPASEVVSVEDVRRAAQPLLRNSALAVVGDATPRLSAALATVAGVDGIEVLSADAL